MCGSILFNPFDHITHTHKHKHQPPLPNNKQMDGLIHPPGTAIGGYPLPPQTLAGQQRRLPSGESGGGYSPSLLMPPPPAVLAYNASSGEREQRASGERGWGWGWVIVFL